MFLSNRYVLTGIQARIKFKDVLKYAFFDLKRMLKENVVPPMTNWPIAAGKVHLLQILSMQFSIFNCYFQYYAFNVNLGLGNFPNVPEGRYKAVFKTYMRNEYANKVNFYARVEH